MKNYFQICLFNRVTIGQMVRPRSLIGNKSKEFQGQCLHRSLLEQLLHLFNLALLGKE